MLIIPVQFRATHPIPIPIPSAHVIPTMHSRIPWYESIHPSSSWYPTFPLPMQNPIGLDIKRRKCINADPTFHPGKLFILERRLWSIYRFRRLTCEENVFFFVLEGEGDQSSSRNDLGPVACGGAVDGPASAISISSW